MKQSLTIIFREEIGTDRQGSAKYIYEDFTGHNLNWREEYHDFSSSNDHYSCSELSQNEITQAVKQHNLQNKLSQIGLQRFQSAITHQKGMKAFDELMEDYSGVLDNLADFD